MMSERWHTDIDECTEAAHLNRVQRRAAAIPRESALGIGCCPQCGRPRGMVRVVGGGEYRGCRCGEVRDD